MVNEGEFDFQSATAWGHQSLLSSGALWTKADATSVDNFFGAMPTAYRVWLHDELFAFCSPDRHVAIC